MNTFIRHEVSRQSIIQTDNGSICPLTKIHQYNTLMLTILITEKGRLHGTVPTGVPTGTMTC
jgi:hypothetical protein